MQTIELNKVRKSYDQFVAVNNLSFSIEQGGVFGLLGPNGAGKDQHHPHDDRHYRARFRPDQSFWQAF